MLIYITNLLFATCVMGLIYLFLDLLVGTVAIEASKFRKRVLSLRREDSKQIVKKSNVSQIQKLNTLLLKQPYVVKMNRLVEMTGLRVNTSVFLFTAAFISVFFYWFLITICKLSVLISATMATAFFVFAPTGFLKYTRTRYLAKFTLYFPKALQAIKGSLSAGLSLQSAFERAAHDTPYPVNVEFANVVKEIGLGRSFLDAIASLGNRVPTTDMNTFKIGVTVQQQSGGNLVELMKNMESTINARTMMRKEMNSLTAQARMSGLVIGFLPIALAVLIQLMNPEYLSILYTTPEGQKMLTTTIVMQIIGFITIKKMTSIRILT